MIYESAEHGSLSSGFVRPNANFIMIFISDEPDHSSHNYNWYYNYFLSFKSDINKVQAHAVIGPPPTGCSTPFNNSNLAAQFGDGYYQFVNLFNGNIYDICSSNWGMQMYNLAINSLPMSNFELSKEAASGSITVSVDGMQAVGWSFDEASNSVVFDSGFIPQVGSIINIVYGLKEECPE